MNIDKYGIEISDEIVLEILHNLPGKFYKLLPLYEGRDFHTKDIIYDEPDAFETFSRYLQKLIIEFSGSKLIFPDEKKFTEIFIILKGMEKINIGEHDKLKSIVMLCMNKIKEVTYIYQKRLKR